MIAHDAGAEGGVSCVALLASRRPCCVTGTGVLDKSMPGMGRFWLEVLCQVGPDFRQGKEGEGDGMWCRV